MYQNIYKSIQQTFVFMKNDTFIMIQTIIRINFPNLEINVLYFAFATCRVSLGGHTG